MTTSGMTYTSQGAPAWERPFAPDALERVLECLRAGGGFDFADYHRPCLERRVAERLRRADVPDLGAYAELLRHHPGESAALCQTLWINVTDFFRDASVWEVLHTQVLPALIARKKADGPIRVWSAGCATGQEAYSLAMLLADALSPEELDKEKLDKEELEKRVEIVATDVDTEALAHGKRGVYSGRAMASVPLPLRKRFFVPVDENWRVRDELRRVVRFHRQNLLQDRPAGKFDLIVCRNTLIYFRPEAQGQVLARLRHSLRDDGCLLLGRAECPVFHDAGRPSEEHFAPVDLKAHLYGASRS